MDKISVRTNSRFEESESFSRAVKVGDWVFVSNTSGRNYDKQEMPTDVEGQTEQALLNISRALESVGASLQDIVRRVVYIPERANAPLVMSIIGKRMQGINPANTVICSPLGGDEYLVEIEVTALKGAGSSALQTLHI